MKTKCALFISAIFIGLFFTSCIDSMFPEEIQANKYGDDDADSKAQLYLYQSLATYVDNALIDSLAKIFSASVISTRSVDIGIHGKYFVINYNDYK